MSELKIYRSVEPIYISEETQMGVIPFKYFKYVALYQSQAKYFISTGERIDSEFHEIQNDMVGQIVVVDNNSIRIEFTNNNDGSRFYFCMVFIDDSGCCNIMKSKLDKESVNIGVFCLQVNQ